MEPLVSVIVPVYNVLPYLREALDSVINQTYKNLEIIVVDDGSTDGSEEVCDEYLSDPRVTVIHQENRGLSGARNTGLDRMTGEYVAFLDSDDAFMPEMIEKMVNTIIRNMADISICGYEVCYTKKSMNTLKMRKTEIVKYDYEKKLSSGEALNMLISDRICWAVWTKLYKCIIWKDIRFPEGDNYEDMQVMCKVFEKCRHLVTVPNLQVFYRNRGDSISKSQSEKNIQDHLHAILSVEDYIKKNAINVFLPENIYSFQERYARVLSEIYASLLLHPHTVESIEILRNKAFLYWTQLEEIPCQLHSRVTRFLFLHAPVLLLPAQSIWRAGKHLLMKAHT